MCVIINKDDEVNEEGLREERILNALLLIFFTARNNLANHYP